MEERFKHIECNDDDVVSLPGDVTFKVGKFRTATNNSFAESVGDKFSNELITKGINIDMHLAHPNGYWTACKMWFTEGIDCEILSLGAKSWKKGKVKIKVSVEFYAEDEETGESFEITASESPLDDIRRMIN